MGPYAWAVEWHTFSCAGAVLSHRRAPSPLELAAAQTTLPWIELSRVWLIRYIAASLILYLLAGAVMLEAMSLDMSVIALASAALALMLGVWRRTAMISARLTSYLAVISLSYLSGLSTDLSWMNSVAFYLWLGSIAIAIALVMASRARNLFKPSPQDLLTILVVLAIVAFPALITDQSVIASTAVRALIFLYACEVLIMVRPSRASVLGMIGAISLVLLAMLQALPDRGTVGDYKPT